MTHGWMDEAERWVVRGARSSEGRVSDTERVATGLLGVGLLLLSRRSGVWGAPVAVVGGAALARAATGYCPVYASRRDRHPHDESDTAERLGGARGRHIREHLTINQPVEVVERFWRELARMADATRGRVTVEALGDGRSRWHVRGTPDGPILAEWTAEVINDVPGKVIGWRTLSKADVVSAGSVTFRPAPGDQGTEVHVHLQYAAPLGWFGTAAATLRGHAPSVLARETLRDIKRYLDLGRSVTLTA